MKITRKFNFNCLLYNPRISRSNQARQFAATLTFDSDGSLPLSKIDEPVERLTYLLDGSHVIGVQNADLIRLLEPKTGATVHNFLTKLKAEVTGNNFRLIGGTVPHDTINGDRVLVLGPGIEATLEGLAQFVLWDTPRAASVALDDGTHTVEVSQHDLAHLNQLV